MAKFQEANEKIAEGIVEGYEKIEGGVVSGYKKIEETVVGGFNKITDSFVDKFLTKEGETVEEARARMTEDHKIREEKRAADAEKREAAQKARIEASLETSRNAGRRNGFER